MFVVTHTQIILTFFALAKKKSETNKGILCVKERKSGRTGEPQVTGP
jgi:hypothetical protein